MPLQAQSGAENPASASISLFRSRFDRQAPTLPPESTAPLLGRERELQLAIDLLGDPAVRLLTITGPGGIGKTRLALRLARLLHEEFEGDAAFVPLAAVVDSANLMPTIAQAFKLRESGDLSAADQLRLALNDRHVLLVLDNFEQIRDAAPDVTGLLLACPALKVLVTSRVPLHVSGEQELSIPPLASPGTDVAAFADVACYPAVALFAQRARAVKADFALSDGNSAAVAAICRRLDGVPLAIELAAARAKVLSPAALLARLSHSLDVLTGGPRDQPVRLQTLRAAIDWSYELLSPEERSLFDRLAIFTGGFTLGAAEALASDIPDPGRTVLDMVTSLVDCNLLHMRDQSGDEPRFGMLETVREFGLERLAASGQLELIQSRHVGYFQRLAEAAWPIFIGRIGMEPWLQRFEAEHDNVRAALRWAFDANDAKAALRLAGRLSWFWYLHGYLVEGRSWLERALAEANEASAADRALVLHGVGVIAHWQGDDQRALATLEEALPIWEHLGDRWGTTDTLRMLGTIAEDDGDNERAGPLFQLALDQAQAGDDQANVALILDHLGIVTWGLGDVVRAIAYWEEALALHRSFNDDWGAAISLSFLGLVACERHEFATAELFLRESLSLRWQMGITYDLPHGIGNFATLAAARGNLVRAARLFGAADAVREGLGYSLKEPERTIYARADATARMGLGETRYAAARGAGRALSLAEAVADAIASGPLLAPPAPRTSGLDLTAREHDVLVLLVKGHTDREIADALYISPRTAQGHVARLFDKLGFNTRTAAVAAALQDDLLIDQPGKH